MIRRLGVLVVAAGAALLAGCAGPHGISYADADAKKAALDCFPPTPNGPQHDCSEYWGPSCDRLLSLLEGRPIGWAVPGPSATDQDRAVFMSLMRLHETVARSLGPDTPLTFAPGTAETPGQFEVVFWSSRVEDLFEADRFSGHHGSGNEGWLKVHSANPPGVTAPQGMNEEKARRLLRVLKEALDMIQPVQ